MEETTNAIRQSCEEQKKEITTFIETNLNQELGNYLEGCNKKLLILREQIKMT
jgi:hypothetical protein